MSVPSLKLHSGCEMPMVGLGTWKSQEGEVGKAVECAIDCGYRHFDCAWYYKNESEIGNSIAKKIEEGKVKREDLFITSKLWNIFQKPEKVRGACIDSLKKLQLEYLDLYLIHFPFGVKYVSDEESHPQDENGVMYDDTDYVDTWKALEELQKEGLVRNIGVSNFNEYQLDRVVNEGSVFPAVIQIESHPYLIKKDLVNHCQKAGVVVTAYSPLGSNDRPWRAKDQPSLLEDPKLLEIATKMKKSVAQIAMRFQIQRGVIVVPKSVNPRRLAENLQLFDFVLSDEDMESISALNKDFSIMPWNNCRHKYNPTAKNYSE